MNQITTVMTQQEAVTWKRQVGSAANELRRLLAEGYEREAWRALGFGSWTECISALSNEFGLSERHIYRLHSANETERIVLTHGSDRQNVDRMPIIPERALRSLAKLDADDDKREAWRIANETAPNGRVTGAHVAKVVEQMQSPSPADVVIQESSPPITPKAQNYITLDEWNAGVRWHGEPSKTAMNRVNENIEWAAWSWNPVTGCLHNCAYCYARDIANRFYEQKFAPSFVPERLSQPANTKPILPRWNGDAGHRNVFTCSMADLFGKWVPEEWIESVIQVARDNPQWTFLYLTKFPVRMAEFDYPDNVWLGTSVDRQHAVQRAESAFRKIKASGFGGICWLSCEPMLERLTFSSLDMFDWVVMGGASSSTQTPEYRPPFDDIAHLHYQARAAGCMIYQKTNLRIREYPKIK